MHQQKLTIDPYEESRLATAVSVLLDFLSTDQRLKVANGDDTSDIMVNAAKIIARGHGVDQYELSRRTVDQMARNLNLV